MSHALSRVGAALLLTAIAVGGGGSATALAAPQAPITDSDDLAIGADNYCPDGEEQEFLRLINQYRGSKGLGKLQISRTLGAAADHHSRQMASADYFSHTLLNGVSWSKNLAKHGYKFNTFKGENIAAGRAAASEAFQQFKDSPTHNAVMLDPNFTAIGIGRAYDKQSTYQWYWTTTFGGRQDAGPAC